MHRALDPTRLDTTRRQRRTAAATAIILALVTLGLLPVARIVPFVFPGWVPFIGGALVLVDLLSAVIFLRQFALSRRRSLLALGAGFGLTGCLVLPYIFAFPGVVEGHALPGSGTIVSWLFTTWHATFALALIGYAVLESRSTREIRERDVRPWIAVACIGVPVLAIVIAVSIVARAATLPRFIADGTFVPLFLTFVAPLLQVLALLAIVAIVRAGLGSLLNLWLAVAAWASMMDVFSSIAGGGRFTIGWYVSRVDALVAATVVLIALSYESSRLARDIAQAERRTRALVGGVADALITIDADDRITSFNPAAETLFGYLSHDVAGLWLANVVPNLAEYHRLRRGVSAFEARGRHMNGRVFPLELTFGENDDEGERGETIVIARDITQRKRAEDEIKAARDQAIASANAKAQFLATMSHEIRTPINAVVGMSELLLQCNLDAEAHDYAKTVRDSAESLLGVINDILDFSQIEAGKMEVDRRPFSLVSVVENAADICATAARSKGLSLVTHIAPDVPARALGDANRMRQILINLVGNAVKFTGAGNVIVRAVVDHLDGDRIIVRFSVSDTGPGISREQIDRLFEAFVQADGSTRRKFGGSGLGLSISKRLVEMMGGAIGVESTPGEGSTFSFTIPFDRLDEPSAPERSRSLRGARVLVVDDDISSRAIVEQYMMNWGIVATGTDNPVHAIALLKSAQLRGAPFDVALIDFIMPGVDGFALAARIQADPAIRATPLVLVTAHDEPGRGADAVARGFAGYLRKPLKQSALFDAIAVARNPAHREIADLPAAVPATRDGILILVAEDNVVNRKLALQQLKKLGYRAHAVADGREAVEAAAREPYDVILMDCQMPELDGFEAAVAIRKAEAVTGLHVPIVAMTANALEGDREACLAAGMDDYLAKPVQLAGLRAMLERFTTGAVGAR